MPASRTAVDDHSLMALCADVLFTYDARGRMLHENDPERRPAPRVFLGRTRGGHVVRFRQDVPDDLAQHLEKTARSYPSAGPADDLRIPPDLSAAIRRALEPLGPVEDEGGGPAYRFPQTITAQAITAQGIDAQVPQAIQVIQVTPHTLDVVRHTYPWLVDELPQWAPCFAVVKDGQAVSVCFTSRIGPRAVEAGLETLPEHRRHGYGTAATAAWGAHIMEEGRIPIYSTGWDNLASQAVARRLGLHLFGANQSWK